MKNSITSLNSLSLSLYWSLSYPNLTIDSHRNQGPHSTPILMIDYILYIQSPVNPNYKELGKSLQSHYSNSSSVSILTFIRSSDTFWLMLQDCTVLIQSVDQLLYTFYPARVRNIACNVSTPQEIQRVYLVRELSRQSTYVLISLYHHTNSNQSYHYCLWRSGRPKGWVQGKAKKEKNVDLEVNLISDRTKEEWIFKRNSDKNIYTDINSLVGFFYTDYQILSNLFIFGI